MPRRIVVLAWGAGLSLLAMNVHAQAEVDQQATHIARQPQRPRSSKHHLELTLSNAYTRTLSPGRNRKGDRVIQNGGASYLGKLSWRSDYFLWPQLSSGYVPLFEGEARSTSDSPGQNKSINRSYAVPILLGLAAPVWRLRLSTDIGASWLATNIALNNERTRSESWLLTYRVHIAANVIEARTIRLAAFAQALIISEADTYALSFGFEASSDFFSW